MLTDGTQAIVWEATYLPFGEVYQSSGTASINLRFPGQWLQPQTGLHHNWHRQYDPSTGRYLQPDPLGTIDGNRWAYAGNSPLMNIDPEGLAWDSWFCYTILGLLYCMLPPRPSPPSACPARRYSPTGPLDLDGPDDDPCEKQFKTETQQCNAIKKR